MSGKKQHGKYVPDSWRRARAARASEKRISPADSRQGEKPRQTARNFGFRASRCRRKILRPADHKRRNRPDKFVVKNMRGEKEMLELILDTASRDERIRAVILNGSRANPNA